MKYLRALSRDEEDSPYVVNTVACYLFMGISKKEAIELLIDKQLDVYFVGISSEDDRVFIYSKCGETTYYEEINQSIQRVRIFEVTDECIASDIRNILRKPSTEKDLQESKDVYNNKVKELGLE